MRKKAKMLEGKRMRFRATVQRFGTKKTYRGHFEPTILLKDIRRIDNNQQVADHVWFTVRKRINSLNLQSGDVLEFDARVGSYMKGPVYCRTLDYKLNNPTRLVKIVTVKNQLQKTS